MFARFAEWRTAALAVAAEVGLPFERASQAMSDFGGVERRFEDKGTAAGVRVIDDYGHHPAEVQATLSAARQLHDGRVVAIFQPHRYTRTRDLFNEFAGAFHDADLLVLTPIYAAGEEKLPDVDSSALAGAVRAAGHRDVRFAAELAQLPESLAPELRPGDLVITLGAGDISGLGPRLLESLRARETR